MVISNPVLDLIRIFRSALDVLADPSRPVKMSTNLYTPLDTICDMLSISLVAIVVSSLRILCGHRESVSGKSVPEILVFFFYNNVLFGHNAYHTSFLVCLNK